ncbi:SIR2 family protein [Patescibacteria group bacterium]|nr:SIR2 family protein [Patescibacteria group bacterium]MCL5091407.1 SIR2 family protein [Patescibacteria group bacterium]
MKKEKTFLVLGTGASVDGFSIDYRDLYFDSPMDQNFFNTAIVKKLYNQAKFPALHFFQNIKQFSSLETTWSDIDLASKLTNNQISAQRIISLEHEYQKLEKLFQKKSEIDDNFRNNINCQLTWVGKEGCVGPLAQWEAVQLILQIYGNLQLQKEILSSFLNLLLNSSDLQGISTFNYDNSVEQAWFKGKFTERLYYFNSNHSVGYINGIPLFKMHGSINWKATFNNQSGWNFEIPSNIDSKIVEQKYNQGQFINEKPDYIQEPTIIPPDLFKQNITLDLQNDKKSILFKKIWNNAWQQILKIDVLIFAGFSFPDTDHHAKMLFREADRYKPFKKVIVCTLGEKSLNRYYDIFGKDKVIPFTGGIKNIVNKPDQLINSMFS